MTHTGAIGPVREDALLDGRVHLWQPRDGYRVAIDPVLLAAAVPARPGESVLDLGCGVGAAALCLLRRLPEAAAVGVEIQPGLAALARVNAEANGMTDRFRAVVGDVLALPLSRQAGRFHHVMANPPHLSPDSARRSANAGRDIANVEGAAGLADWVSAALASVRARGTVTFVHRADRLDELLAALAGHVGGIVVFPLWPAAGRDAKRVLVQGRKGVKTPGRLAAGLTLHDAGGGFTPAADDVLREGRALAL